MSVGLAKTTNFPLPLSFNKTAFIKKVSSIYPVVKEKSNISRQTLFDTFDWRLYNKDYLLLSDESVFYLTSIQYDKVIASVATEQKVQYRFWWDFPKGPLKKILKRQTSVRALLPLVNLQIHSQTFHLLNNDKKTVLYLVLEDIYIGEENSENFYRNLKLQPIRGYDNDYEQCCRFLHSHKLKPKIVDTFAQALQAVNKHPGNYSSKINIRLKSDWSAHIALKAIFNYLLNVMKKNEAGIIADVDTEFLHDFRVSIRRTRAALTQLKGIFETEATNHYKQEFTRLAKKTNRLRDLDVYLLKRAKYESMLPQELGPDLAPMFDVLSAIRIKEHQNVIKSLNSPAYKKTIKKWEAFLDQSTSIQNENGQNANKPIFELAQKSIWKKYKKIIRLGLSISKESPDTELHKLRIECKKLRYLLEFFTSLFPTLEIQHLVKQLQKLQDNLGDINDLHIQQVSLKHFVHGELKSAKYHKTKVAIGGLIAVLHQRQQIVRQKFEQTFVYFSTEQNALLYKKLFR
jgi:CHAD domain-containing protein